MDQRIVGAADPSPLKVLASVVEPPKGFPREGDREYDVFTPLSHLADVIPSESDVARRLRDLAGRIVAGSATPAEHAEVRRELMLLRENDAHLQPAMQTSAIAAELGPISKNVSQTASIGLEALDSIEGNKPERNKPERNKPLDAASQTRDLVTLKAMHATSAELTDAIVAAVEALVAGAAGKR